MKKQILFSIVGGLAIWIWQFISFMQMNLHQDSVSKLANQEEVMQFLKEKVGKSGAYLLPQPDHAMVKMEEAAAYEASIKGKPWARIFYYESYDTNMMANVLRGLLTNIVLIFMFSILIKNIPNRNLSKNLLISLIVGMIIFVNGIYTNHMWYPLFDLNIHLLDCVVEWTMIGLIANMKLFKFA